MKVLIVIYNLGVGGIFTFAKNLATNLRSSHHVDASLYVYIPESVNLNKQLVKDLGFPVYTAYSSKTSIIFFNTLSKVLGVLFPMYDFRSSILNYFLQRTVRRRKINLLHSNYQQCDLACLKIREKENIKVVITDHGSYRMQPLPQDRIDLMHRIARKADALIALTDSTKDNFSLNGIDISKKLIFKKIYNGVDLSNYPDRNVRIEGVETDDFVFGMLARGTKEKGWEIAIKAFLLVKAQNPQQPMKLMLTGEGAYLKELSKIYKKNTEIIFTGETNTPLNFIQHFHVGLFPSYLNVESMPFSIIEYLLCNKPVLATNIGAITDMIGTDGQLAGDILDLDDLNPSNMASLMNRYLNDKKLIVSKTKLASEAVKKFDIRSVTNQYLEVYQKTC